MGRVLFYLPLLFLNWSKLLLPRWIFTRCYSSSTDNQQKLEQTIRNAQRRAAYMVRKTLI